jgi:hypothetical protein
MLTSLCASKFGIHIAEPTAELESKERIMSALTAAGFKDIKVGLALRACQCSAAFCTVKACGRLHSAGQVLSQPLPCLHPSEAQQTVGAMRLQVVFYLL